MDGADEVTRNHPRALMDELIERVLAVGPRFAPDDRSRGVVDNVALAVDTFAVAFHVPLLEIGSKAMHILIVWQNCLTFSTEKISVPNT